jgi:hypothetical protein
MTAKARLASCATFLLSIVMFLSGCGTTQLSYHLVTYPVDDEVIPPILFGDEFYNVDLQVASVATDHLPVMDLENNVSGHAWELSNWGYVIAKELRKDIADSKRFIQLGEHQAHLELTASIDNSSTVNSFKAGGIDSHATLTMVVRDVVVDKEIIRKTLEINTVALFGKIPKDAISWRYSMDLMTYNISRTLISNLVQDPILINTSLSNEDIELYRSQYPDQHVASVTPAPISKLKHYNRQALQKARDRKIAINQIEHQEDQLRERELLVRQREKALRQKEAQLRQREAQANPQKPDKSRKTPQPSSTFTAPTRISNCTLDHAVAGVERNTIGCNQELRLYDSPQPGGQCVSLIASVELLTDILGSGGPSGCSNYEIRHAREISAQAINTLRRAQSN